MKVTKRVSSIDSLGPSFLGKQKVRGDNLLVAKSSDQTVHATSGKYAADSKLRFLDRGRTCCSGTTTFSAYPLPPTKTHT